MKQILDALIMRACQARADWSGARMNLANQRVIDQKKAMEARGISTSKKIKPVTPEQHELARLRRWRDLHAQSWATNNLILAGARKSMMAQPDAETVRGV